MNDPEVTMSSSLRPTPGRLQAHTVALQAAGIVIRLAVGVPAPLRSLADQAIRAASSVALNLAEGAGRNGRDRLHHWRIAYGSALEAGSALALLGAIPGIDHQQATHASELLDRVRAMTWRLLHPRGPR